MTTSRRSRIERQIGLDQIAGTVHQAEQFGTQIIVQIAVDAFRWRCRRCGGVLVGLFEDADSAQARMR